MTIIDISRRMWPGMAVWPGDAPLEIEEVAALSEGDAVNVTTLKMSAHTGTHVDAPYHFVADGTAMDAVALRSFWGAALVVTVEKEAGPLNPSDFDHADLTQAPRLLVHSAASERDPAEFPAGYVYPSPALADFLAERGVILLGTDAPSMDSVNSKDLAGHHALYRNGISILEGLTLSGVADGVYELVALPLKIDGGDGAPVRAALRPL